MLPLGFEPQVLIRVGRGGRARWGAAWWRISCYHPGAGIGIQILFPEDRQSSKKLEFLGEHCVRLYTLPDSMAFFSALDGLEKELRERLGGAG